MLESWLGDPDIDTDLFNTARAITTERSYICNGAYLAEQTTQAMLGNFSQTFDLTVFTTREGKIGVSIFQPEFAANYKEYTDLANITKGTFKIDFTTDEIINDMVYSYN